MPPGGWAGPDDGETVVASMPGGLGPPGWMRLESARPPFPLTATMTVAEFMRGMPLTFGTYYSPVKFYRIRSREEIAADERREAAGKALAVLRKPRDSDVSRRMSGQPCGSCALGPVPRLLPLGFPLAVAGAGG